MTLAAQAIALAYQDHAEELRSYLQARTRCRRTAEDLTQDAFIRLYSAGAHDGIDDLKSYLFRIAHNLLIDHHRWMNRRSAPCEVIDITDESSEELALTSPAPSAEEMLQWQDDVRAVCRSIAHLSPTCQRIFWLSRWFGYHNYEIAAMLGVCMSTVEKNVSKATRCCAAHVLASA